MKPRRVTGALAVGAALGVVSSADAATFNVSNNADAGAGSLRQAVLDANGNPGADTITFDASLSGSTITLSTGEMLISDAVDIQGPGSANLTVDANQASRVFYVYNPSPAPLNVTISGLTLTKGSASGSDDFASAGGAISVVGENLTLDDVQVTASNAFSAGGGIAFFGIDSTSSYNNVSNVLSIQNSVISGNESGNGFAGVGGGGIVAAGVYSMQLDNVTVANNNTYGTGGGIAIAYIQDGGSVTIQSSAITGNTATGEGGQGGGLYLYDYYSEGGTGAGNVSLVDTTVSGNTGSFGGGIASDYVDLSVGRSTISGNTSNYAGGGVAVVNTYGTTIENSTIANNQSGRYGGGVYAAYSYLTLKETTVSGNDADQQGGGLSTYGYNDIEIIDSILANSTVGAVAAADLDTGAGTTVNIAYSLVEDTGTSSFNDGGGNILDAGDPQLGPLQNNGGPTLTMLPAAGSPVVNAGDPGFTPPPSTDQRGFARVAGGRIDMGAVELNTGTLQFSIVAQSVGENAGTATVNVTRTGGTDGPASAQVTVNGASTATGGGVDYTFGGATVNFASGDATPQSFNVTIVDDGAVEPSETVVLTLGNPAGATLGANVTHTITINDNDVAIPVADVSITKSVTPGAFIQGGNVSFTLNVNNAGPDAASNVVVTDTLPAQLTYVSATPSTGSCSGTTTITCNLGTLNAGGSATISVVATMTGAGPTTNAATVTASTGDNDPADNAAQVTFTIAAARVEPIPALDSRMQMLLAALLAAAALGLLSRR